MNVAILGTSKKPERYAHMALTRLVSHGHSVFPVNPALKSIDGYPVFPSLGKLPKAIDTLTVYIGPQHIETEIPSIITLNPKRKCPGYTPVPWSCSVASNFDVSRHVR